MTFELDHVAVRSRDRRRAAEDFAGLIGATPGASFGPWTPVAVNGALTILFTDADPFVLGHLAFRTDAATFDRVLEETRRRHFDFGSSPGPEKDGRVSVEQTGERRVYVRDADGNSFEFMTRDAASHE